MLRAEAHTQAMGSNPDVVLSAGMLGFTASKHSRAAPKGSMAASDRSITVSVATSEARLKHLEDQIQGMHTHACAHNYFHAHMRHAHSVSVCLSVLSRSHTCTLGYTRTHAADMQKEAAINNSMLHCKLEVIQQQVCVNGPVRCIRLNKARMHHIEISIVFSPVAPLPTLFLSACFASFETRFWRLIAGALAAFFPDQHRRYAISRELV